MVELAVKPMDNLAKVIFSASCLTVRKSLSTKREEKKDHQEELILGFVP